jgi:hypothetical protein
MSGEPAPQRTCAGCGARLEECACCDEPDCPAPICRRCLDVAVGHRVLHPHEHGG